ncbi:MAG TPA: metal ABC transporter ATP-binding protein [Anaerolineae bacterium]|nr:metal ABC transporter ATP-binding protein [Anaerolineae bacterium]
MAFLWQVVKKREGIAHESPAVRVTDVSVRYGGKRSVPLGRTGGGLALDNISFTVETGEKLAVVGPNGAGKSTLFKLLSGVLGPSEGDIEVFGGAIQEHTCVAYVPQRSQIDWSFPVTVADVVMMGRVNHIGLFRWPRRKDWQIVDACLARVGATNLANKQIGNLSGGQQQRVFIARALAQETELLLLDEPLAGLDIPSQEAIFEILDGLQGDGVTMVVATHDLNMAAERFDQMLLLNKRIVAWGKPKEVLTPDYLMQAYGGHLHMTHDEQQQPTLLVPDSCCGDEAEGITDIRTGLVR